MLALVLVGFTLCVRAAPMSVDVGATHYAKMKLLIVVIGKESDLKECAHIMQKDFSFSGQFDAVVEECEKRPSKALFKKWFNQGYLLALFINPVNDENAFEWRLYDTNQVAMLKGKKYNKRGKVVRGWAHNMADIIWPEMMGGESNFSTKIAYCKQVPGKGKHSYRHIYIADYDGSMPQLLIGTPTVNVAPRWNKDLAYPLLFYSESSQTNISLRVAAMDGRRQIASDFDGLNMLPTFSKDGKKVVYCISHGNGHCHLYLYEKGQLQQLTDNSGNNISPTLSDDGNRVFFCSDFKGGVPLIYCYDRTSGVLEQITETGSCFSPSYCQKSKKLAYIKRINGVMQIFIYDEKTKEHRQFTTDSLYHKEECSWSPCGTCLIFCLTSGNKSRLAIEQLVTRERHIITAATEHCNYPAWSPIYTCFPFIDRQVNKEKLDI